MKNNRIEICYPSYSKKAITFTIDDGNIPYDTKLLGILKPAGIKGTFNLNSNLTTLYSPEFYRAFYKGYEIANHCKYHPYVLYDGVEYKLKNEVFSEESADPDFMYPADEKEGFFWVIKPNGWRQAITESDFIKYIDDGKSELNAIFGEGSVRDFVWPYCEQDNAAVKAHIKTTHCSSRKTGCTLANTGFDIPDDKYAWSYNANHMNLLEVAEEYDGYPDDGRLKFFAFGVHSIDFERDSKWDDLAAFAEKYGNRPSDFWYASVGEIFDYEAAVKMLVINNEGIYNPSSLPIYIKVNGKNRVVSPLGVVALTDQ